MNATAMKPKTEVPQPTPKESYIAFPANGSNAPMSDRSTVEAADTEAAYLV